MNELFAKGCARWQARREGFGSTEEAVERFKRAGRKPALSTFLREEYNDASRKFWEAGNKSVETPEKSWIEVETAFQHLLIRLRRKDKGSRALEGGAWHLKEKWIYDKEIENFEKAWAVYWEIEKKWLRPEQEKTKALKLFKSLGGTEVFDQIFASTLKSNCLTHEPFNDLMGWAEKNVALPYLENSYLTAVRNADAFMHGLADRALSKPSDIAGRAGSQEWAKREMADLKLLQYGGREAAVLCSLTMINLRVSGSFDILNRHFQSTPFSFWLRFMTDMTDRLANVLEFDWQYTMRPLNLRNAIAKLLKERETTDGAGVSSVVMVGTIEEFVRIASWQKERQGSNAAFDQVVPIGVRNSWQDLGTLKESEMNWEELQQVINDPTTVVHQELEEMRSGKAANSREISSKLHLIGANAHLLVQGGEDLEAAAQWIASAIEVLTGSENYLAWNEVFEVSQSYMEKRGNILMTDHALVGQRELQNAALGESVDLKELDRQRIELENRMVSPSQGRKPTSEDKVRQLLLDGPPPLRRKKRNASGRSDN